jgi:predicted amidohydrolase YtcJ
LSSYFSGGTIWCGKGSFAQSLRIDQGKIVALDCPAEASDELIDLQGAFLAPAFMDGHAHPLFAGRESQGPKVNQLQSVLEIVTEVKRFADNNPDVTWIVGGAYEAAIIEGGDFLAQWIDEYVADRPVVLQAVDHHTIWVNSKAFELAGISALTVDPVGGTIARNSDGSPRGTLREPSAMALIMKHAPARTREADVEAISWASQQYLAHGVTSATDAWVEPGMAEAYITAAASGVLSIDVNLFFLAQPNIWKDESEYFAGLRQEILDLGSDSRLAARTIKFLCDGAFSSGTAAVLEPYLDDPLSKGLLIWDDAELLEAALHFDLQKYQLHLHAIGDAAVRQVLDVVEKVQETNPSWDRRPVIAHAQLISEQDLPRFAQLGVIANYQPLWCYLDPMNKELIAPRLGEERNNRQYQLASLLKSGAQVSYGSDWPVTSFVPLEALAVPTHRQSPGGFEEQAWSAHEAISIEDSLSSYTEGVAYQLSKEERVGRIALGFDADLMILERNPLEVDLHAVKEIKILGLYKSGLRVR